MADPFKPYTLEQLRARFIRGVRSVSSELNVSRGATTGDVGEAAVRLFQGVQVGAKFIRDQIFPSPVMDGSRLDEIVAANNIKPLPARKARALVLLRATDLDGTVPTLSGSETVTINGATFTLVGGARSVLSLYLNGVGVLYEGASHETVFSAGDPQLTTTRTFVSAATSYPNQWPGIEDGNIPRGTVLRENLTDYLLAVKRPHYGSRGTVDVYPFDPFNTVAPQPAADTVWYGTIAACTAIFEANDTGHVEFYPSDSATVNGSHANLDSIGIVLEADQGGDEDGTVETLARLAAGSMSGRPARYNAQWYREAIINNPDVAVSDAYVFMGARGPGTVDICAIPQNGQEMPIMSAEILDAYIKGLVPYREDPRVVPLLADQSPPVPWILKVTLDSDNAPDPVGTVTGGPTTGVLDIYKVTAQSTGTAGTVIVSAVNGQTLENDWVGAIGSRMLFVGVVGGGGVPMVDVVTVEGWATSGLILRTTKTWPSYDPYNPSTDDTIGTLYRYSDLYDTLAAAIQVRPQGEASGHVSNIKYDADYGNDYRAVCEGMFLHLDIVARVPGKVITPGVSARTLMADPSAGHRKPNPSSEMATWPEYDSIGYRDAVAAKLSVIDGVINVEHASSAWKFHHTVTADAADVAALNIYEFQTIYALIDLQEAT